MPDFESLFPELGFSTPSYPAQFRQVTSYTWRPRQREIPLWYRPFPARPRSWSMSGVRRGGLGESNSDRSSSWRHLGRDLAAEAARGSPKTREGTERRRARGATHTVVRRTRAEKLWKTDHFLSICKMKCFWSRIKARQTLRTAKNFEHERLEAHHVDSGLLANVASEAKRRLTMLK